MGENRVKTVELAASRVVSGYGYGPEPEMQSQAVMSRFFELMGWDREELEQHRIYGFNNPDPSEGTGSYGYEHWITVDKTFVLPEEVPEGITMKEMPGGLYASLESPGIPNPEKWGGVVRWINGSEYQYDGSRQWLEQIVLNEAATAILTGNEQDPEGLTFNLMSPVVAAAERLK